MILKSHYGAALFGKETAIVFAVLLLFKQKILVRILLSIHTFEGVAFFS
jgi:hypothetical protein